MVCQAGCDPWRTTSRQQLPDLSQPQATVWARGSFGMGLARSCALTAVRHLLAQGLRRTEQTGRQQRRAWDDDTPRKRGAKHSTSRPAVRPCGEGWCAGGRARHGPGPWRPPRWGHALWGGPSAWSSAGVPSRWRGGACPLAPHTPGGGRGCSGCGGGPGRSRGAGRCACWPLVAWRRPGCCDASHAGAGIRVCASTQAAACGPLGRRGGAPCRPWRRGRARAGAARASP